MELKSKISCLLLISGLFLMTTCQDGTKEDPKGQSKANELLRQEIMESIGYDFEHPNQKIKLHHDLDEISGLSYFSPDSLAAVEDEKGKVYIIDIKEEKIVKKLKFAKAGDYEGVEVVQDTVYIVKSNGHLYRFSLKRGDEKNTKVKNLPFTSKNDIEGLGSLSGEYPALLIACKASPKINHRSTKDRAIYRYDIKEGTLEESPWLLITKNDIDDFVFSHDLKKYKGGFKPSGIAVHPLSNDIYILSHASKHLLVYHPDKSIKAFITLDKDRFDQPEGICFSPDGTLFLSNEAQGGRGNILRFDAMK